MGIPDGAHTHHGHGGGGGVITVLLVIAAAVLLTPAAAVAVQAVIITVAVVLGIVAAAAVVAAVAWHRHRGRLEQPRPVRQVTPAPWQAVQGRTEPRAIEQHVHFHNLSAEDVAAIIRQQDNR